MKLAYFVHDVHDAAVTRRVDMLQRGGAEVVVLGFRRSDTPRAEILGAPVHDLGRTVDGKLAQRALSVVKAVAAAGRWRAVVAGCDVVMARNLEMLAIANRVRDLAAPRSPLIYECLDIHRAMLSDGAPGKLLRGLERSLLARSALLIVSSPAFLSEYFEKMQASRTPALLLENKVAVEGAPDRRTSPALPPGRPWRIGWFGVIRCRRSLQILADLVRTHPGLVEVVIRGKPAYQEFDDFQGVVDATPGLSFEGPYAREDLARIYGEVHLTWAIDYFEVGQNSDWLLPNRLYEGGLYGAPAIALESVQTGRWLAARQAGILLKDPAEDLPGRLDGLTVEQYSMLFDQTARIPTADLAADADDCRRLVTRLAQARAE